MLSRSAEKKSAQSDQFAMNFLHFWMSESCIFVIWDAPGGPFCPFLGFLGFGGFL